MKWQANFMFVQIGFSSGHNYIFFYLLLCFKPLQLWFIANWIWNELHLCRFWNCDSREVAQLQLNDRFFFINGLIYGLLRIGAIKLFFLKGNVVDDLNIISFLLSKIIYQIDFDSLEITFALHFVFVPYNLY